MAAGFRLLHEKSYDQALEIFNAAARANPDNVGAHFGRARALEAVGRRPEAVKEFQLCLLLKPDKAIADVCNKELDYMTTRVAPVPPNPTLTEREVEKAATTITNQAAEGIQRLQRECGFTPRPPKMLSRHPMRWSTTNVARADEARRRSQALRECADSLRTDMSTKPSQWDGIYLSPQGTNLYVRNYVTFDAQKPEVVEPLKADQLSYLDLKKLSQQKKK
jgi:tetratricopeptide (TPR) repeat protein